MNFDIDLDLNALIRIGWEFSEYGICKMRRERRNYIQREFIIMNRRGGQLILTNPSMDTVHALVKERQAVAVYILGDATLEGREALLCQMFTGLDSRTLWQFFRSTDNGIKLEEREVFEAEDDMSFFPPVETGSKSEK